MGCASARTCGVDSVRGAGTEGPSTAPHAAVPALPTEAATGAEGRSARSPEDNPMADAEPVLGPASVAVKARLRDCIVIHADAVIPAGDAVDVAGSTDT